MKLLLAYATVHGSTIETARVMYDRLTREGYTVRFTPVENVTTLDEYDAVIAGTPIHNGLWLPAMSHFINRFRAELTKKPCYFWISCIRVLEADSYEHVLNHYLRVDVLKEFNVRHYAAFAGRLELTEIDFNERWSLAVRYDGHQTPERFDGDYRDWKVIENWAGEVMMDLKMLASPDED